MPITYKEIEVTSGGHSSFERVNQTWDGNPVYAQDLPDLMPSVRFRQTDGDGTKYYTSQSRDLRFVSAGVSGGQPEDIEDLIVAGYFEQTSYANYLHIGAFKLTGGGGLLHYGGLCVNGYSLYNYAVPVFKEPAGGGDVETSFYGFGNDSIFPFNTDFIMNAFFQDSETPGTSISAASNDITKEYIRYWSADFPIFETKQDLIDYIADPSHAPASASNYTDAFDDDITGTYYIYNEQQNVTQLRGQIKPVSGAAKTWHSEKILANIRPAAYLIGGNSYRMDLLAPSVVASKHMTSPGYVIDNLPQESFTPDVLEYSGPFYGTYSLYKAGLYTIPADGTYMYGISLKTNIPIFRNLAEAKEAIAKQDYSKAINWTDIQDGKDIIVPKIGEEERETEFDDGPAMSPLVSSYVCDQNDVLNIANLIYTADPSILDNIKKGLELFGADPFNAICGLSWFPFDISQIVTTTPQTHIYFGSYKHDGVSVDKVVNLKAGGFIDAGTVYLDEIKSYTSAEPWLELMVYLPYVGWEKLDIAKYEGKAINIRYYIDIYTNTGVCVLLTGDSAGMHMVDFFPVPSIGVTLPICGSNLSEYANSMLQSVMGVAGGVVGGAMGGMMLPGGPVTAAAGAAVGGALALSTGVLAMSQKGSPKDHVQVRGAYSGASGAYMPGYVIFRLDQHRIIMPNNLTELYGRPSSASGTVGSFSGFLKCDTIKLNTSGMTDDEIVEVTGLLTEGIII